jgi:hypothetical protein
LKFEKHGVLRFKPNERKVAPARLKATPGRSKKAKEQAVKDTEKKYVAYEHRQNPGQTCHLHWD